MKFSGTGLFKHEYVDSKRISKFEERIVMVEADCETRAEELILSEFGAYAIEGISFIGVYDIREMYPGEGPVIEVASTLRIFEGTEEEYVHRYWNDLRPESCDKVGWVHVWFCREPGLSACYNCQEERVGELWRDS